jgi:hypothetical protein
MCAFPFRRAAVMIITTFVVSSCLPPAFAQKSVSQSGAATVVCGSTAEATPSGPAVVLPSGVVRDQSTQLQAVANQHINGVAVQINWRDIEPMQGQFDWSRLDAIMAAAQSSGKWVQLDIFPGFFSPAWALEGVHTDMFAIQYGPGSGATTNADEHQSINR